MGQKGRDYPQLFKKDWSPDPWRFKYYAPLVVCIQTPIGYGITSDLIQQCGTNSTYNSANGEITWDIPPFACCGVTMRGYFLQHWVAKPEHRYWEMQLRVDGTPDFVTLRKTGFGTGFTWWPWLAPFPGVFGYFFEPHAFVGLWSFSTLPILIGGQPYNSQPSFRIPFPPFH